MKEAGFELRAHGVTVQEPSAVCVSHSQLQAASFGYRDEVSVPLGPQYPAQCLPRCSIYAASLLIPFIMNVWLH